MQRLYMVPHSPSRPILIYGLRSKHFNSSIVTLLVWTTCNGYIWYLTHHLDRSLVMGYIPNTFIKFGSNSSCVPGTTHLHATVQTLWYLSVRLFMRTTCYHITHFTFVESMCNGMYWQWNLNNALKTVVLSIILEFLRKGNIWVTRTISFPRFLR